jgi:hypothetical protein
VAPREATSGTVAPDGEEQPRFPPLRHVTWLLLVAGLGCWFERMLPEGFLNAPGAGGSDALVDRQCLL